MFANGVIFIDAVDTIDCAIFEQQRGVVGQSWYLDVQAQGCGDHNYFVSDFKELKHRVRAFVRQHLDHRLLLPSHPAVQRRGDTWLLGTTADSWTYSCPPSAVLQLPAASADRESTAAWLNTALRKSCDNAPKITARLRPQHAQPGYCFHYTHGLPGHNGNCQRLLHGHLGRVAVRNNGKHCAQLENYLARTVLKHNVHFLNSQHITSSGAHIEVAYESSQGNFRATFPRRHAVILPAMESSIEAITLYLAAQLQAHNPVPRGAEIVCYEGIDKGSSCALQSNSAVNSTMNTGSGCSS